MNEVRYMISEASKKLEVEAHVLRYWEDELELAIKRNEMGHRYYTKEDMQVFEGIKELKNQGFQLKAIKLLLPDIRKANGRSLKHLYRLRDELNRETGSEHLKETAVTAGETEIVPAAETDKPEPVRQGDKMQQFQIIMGNLIRQAMSENNQAVSRDISEQVSDSVLKEMDYLMRLRDEREEERFRNLDEAIRSYQKLRKEVAAAEEDSEKAKKKRGLFGRQK